MGTGGIAARAPYATPTPAPRRQRRTWPRGHLLLELSHRHMKRPEADDGDAGCGQERPERARVGKERRDDEVQAAEQRDGVECRGEPAPAHEDAIEDDVESGHDRARRQEHHEPAVRCVERRRLPIEREEKEEHPLVEVLQRVGHHVEAHAGLRVLVERAARPPSGEGAEEEDDQQPREPERDRQPARVLEPLAREGHDAHAERERVRRVKPPEFAPVLMQETTRARRQPHRRGRRRGVRRLPADLHVRWIRRVHLQLYSARRSARRERVRRYRLRP